MKDKSGLADDIQRSIRGKLQELGGFIARQLSESEMQAGERAHLATRGDRPFVGCNPYQPHDAAGREKPVTAPLAAPRPGLRER
jgi:hypothetical protein